MQRDILNNNLLSHGNDVLIKNVFQHENDSEHSPLRIPFKIKIALGAKNHSIVQILSQSHDFFRPCKFASPNSFYVLETGCIYFPQLGIVGKFSDKLTKLSI